jgi:hypothetical protein
MGPPHGLRGWLRLAAQFGSRVFVEASQGSVHDGVRQNHCRVKVADIYIVHLFAHARVLRADLVASFADIGRWPYEAT